MMVNRKITPDSGYNGSHGSQDLSPEHGPVKEYVPLIDKIKRKLANQSDPFFSLEFFPPRTKEGASNLFARFDCMRAGGPLFCDITWHNSSNKTSDEECVDSICSLNIACVALNYCGIDVLLHITCVSQTKDSLRCLLEKVKDRGIRNILALRGDKPEEGEEDIARDFTYAVDMIRFIREEYGSYFVIACAGYPKGHPECESYQQDLIHLKAKIDAGADFIVTQLFFESETFISFVDDCRNLDIDCPIIPGVMPIQSYDSLRHMVKLSQLEVPQCIIDTIEPIKGNDAAIRNFGVEQCATMCQQILDAGITPGIHFYTLNREVAVKMVLKRLNMWNDGCLKPLPWLTPVNHKRCSEDVRPIFWSSRPKSYVYRTQTWDEFPNGRWGSSASPAFGELKDYYMFIGKRTKSLEELKRIWGQSLTSEQDVWQVFYHYVSRTPNVEGHLVHKLPWNETEDLEEETLCISEYLAKLNLKGVLTINSQPNVNGVDSNDPIFGWGHPDGYVYQKAYLEFFTKKSNIQRLLQILSHHPLINYNIIDKTGNEHYTNCHKYRPIAVTWGVFPGKEVVQPTVVDPVSFKVWKDEAFSIWTDIWGSIYPKDSDSFQLLQQISDSYVLVNMVDNQFPQETSIWNILGQMLD